MNTREICLVILMGLSTTAMIYQATVIRDLSESISGLQESGAPSVIQTGPNITTNVESSSRVQDLERKAHLRGYYTRKDYATITGESLRTIDRKKDSGEIPYEKDPETGEIKIPLSGH